MQLTGIETEHVVLAKAEMRERAARNEWPAVTLGSCASLVGDKVTPANCGDFPYIGLEHIGQGTLSLLGTGKGRDVESTKTAFRSGDILFGKLRPYFRKVVRARFDGICSTDIWVVRPQQGVEAGYLFYLLASPPFVEFANQGAEGTRMPRAKWGHVQGFPLRLPPIAEQHAIAHILGVFDDKIELNRRMGETLEQTVRALFKSWFVDFDPVFAGTDAWTHAVHSVPWAFPGETTGSELGTIPKGWRVLSLADCFNLTMGQSPPGWTYNENGEGLPFFQGSKDFGFKYPTNRKFCARPNRVAEPGDTLVSVRAPIGDINLAFERCCIGRGVASLRHKSEAISYTYHYISSMRPKLRQYENEGTVFGALNRHQFGRLRVVEPCPKIINLFESFSRPLDELITANWLECQTLVAVRDTLLPKLLSGQIRIRDAEKIAEAAT